MSGINKSKGGWLKNPKLPRTGETIGGGYFVFRRGDDTKRIRPSQWPFEYASEEEALAQAAILAVQNPGYRFQVLTVVSEAYCDPAKATEEAA
jgi:hypothetical protein